MIISAVAILDTKPNIENQSLESIQRQFKYSEVIRITNNFERILGKGGFGSVYHGCIDDTQVAVKMLSPSSIQGYQQFQAEASNYNFEFLTPLTYSFIEFCAKLTKMILFKLQVKLLLRVHHKNLTTLVGYCNEGTHMGLIYEFMANRDLEAHLSGLFIILSCENTTF
jgi:serine/threonine protein kinase